jgi:uncharacterized membrane protein YtjA (UPF0391 family)
MLRLAVLFFLVSLIAAFCGYGGVAALSFEAARIFFVVFLILAVLFLLGSMFRSSYPRDLI